MDVPFGGITHNCCIIDAKLFSGDIVVISYNNSVGQEISGCRGRQPLHIFGIVYLAAKSLRTVFLYFIGILFFSKSVDNLLLI